MSSTSLTKASVSVVVNFLSQVIFVFLSFLSMVMYANEVETKEKEKITWYKKKKLQHICFDIQVQNTEYVICRGKSGKHVEIIVKEL